MPQNTSANLSASPAGDVVMSRDGRTLYVAGSDGNVRVYDLASGALIATYDVGTRLGGIDLSPDGSFLMIVELEPIARTFDQFGRETQTVATYRLDLATGAIRTFSFTTTGIDGPFYDIAIAANGDAIVTQQFRGSGWVRAYTLDTDTGAYTGSTQIYRQNSVLSASLDRTEFLLAEANISNAPLNIVTLGSNNMVQNVHQSSASGFNRGVQAFSLEGNLVAQYVFGTGILIFDADLKFITNLSNLYPQWRSGFLADLAFDATGSFLYVLDTDTDKIFQLSTADFAIVDSFPIGINMQTNEGGFGNRLLVNPDGRSFTVITDNGVQLVGSIGSTDSVTGTDAADTLVGGAASTRLDGGAGDDVLSGQGGNDTLLGGEGGDTLNGNGGNDVLNGGNGADRLFGGDGADVLEGAGDDDFLAGGAGNDRLFGGDGADMLDGGDGNDLLHGGVGADRMTGGAGDDLYFVADAGDEVVESVGDGTDEVRTSLTSYMLAANLENLTGLLSTGQILAGNALNNVVTGGGGGDELNGGDGDDVIIGGRGNDRIDGGAGSDTVDYSRDGGSRGAVVNLTTNLFLAPSAGSQLARSIGPGEALDSNDNLDTLVGIENVRTGDFADVVYGNDSANVIDTGGGNDLLVGFGGNDDLRGGAGNDTLDGGAGDDVMTGGTGNDIYFVDTTGDVVIENAGEGRDEVRTRLANYTLGANLETLNGVLNVAYDLRGNTLDNFLLVAATNTNANFFRLQDGGEDVAQGALGNDAFYFGAALSAGDRVFGGGGADVVALQGNYAGLTLGVQVLVDVETLSLLTGANTRFGESGTNRFDYNVTSVDANVAAGARLIVNASTLLAGEDLTFNGSAETNGSFLIYGGMGTDTLTGGAGADVFFMAEGRFTAGDRFIGGAGADILVLRGDYNVTFAADTLTGIETVTLMSAADTRFFAGGERYSYNVTTNDGNVAAGATLTINGAKLLVGETMRFDGSAETDGAFRIFGGADADVLRGGAGNDLIFGGLGADTMSGGGGNDVFRYQSVAESTSAGRDGIQDFATGDLIDLSRIDAIAGSPENDAFSFIGSGAFTRTAGQLRVVANGSIWTVQGDIDGDGVSDIEFIVTVTDNHPLAASDFIL